MQISDYDSNPDFVPCPKDFALKVKLILLCFLQLSVPLFLRSALSLSIALYLAAPMSLCYYVAVPWPLSFSVSLSFCQVSLSLCHSLSPCLSDSTLLLAPIQHPTLPLWLSVSMWLYVFAYLGPSLHLSLCLSLCVSVALCFSLSISVSLSVCVFLCLWASRSKQREKQAVCFSIDFVMKLNRI